MADTIPVTVRIPVEVNRQLERLAEGTARSKSWLAAEAIGAYVASESEFLAAVADGRKAAREGRTVSHDKVRRWLSSWGSEREGRAPRVK
jgi:predicted transcriptional regulator